MKYILGILRLAFGLGAIAVGTSGLHQYFGGYEKDLTILEKLKKEGATGIAELDTAVLEIKIKGITTKILAYKYNVNGKSYKGQHSIKSYDELFDLSREVTYLPSDPKISSLNVEGELALASKRASEAKSSSFELWIGIGLVLFGLWHVVRGIFTFRNKPPQKVTPPPLPKESDYV